MDEKNEYKKVVKQSITENVHKKIDIIWELTQSILAVLITVITLYVAMRMIFVDKIGETAFNLLSNSFFLVIGFYFGTKNKQK